MLHRELSLSKEDLTNLRYGTDCTDSCDIRSGIISCKFIMFDRPGNCNIWFNNWIIYMSILGKALNIIFDIIFKYFNIFSSFYINNICNIYFFYLKLLSSIFSRSYSLPRKNIFNDKWLINPKEFIVYHGQVLILYLF